MSLAQLLNTNKGASASVAATGIAAVDLGAAAHQGAGVAVMLKEQEQLMVVAQALETLNEAAEASLEDGGMDQGQAALFNVAAQTHLNQFDVPSIVPNMQSFGGSQGSRMQGTRLAMESVKQKLKDFWAAIVAQAKKIAAKITAWFREFMNKVPGLIKRAEAVKAKADKTKGEIDTKKFDISGSAVNTLRIGKKVETKEFPANIDALRGDIESIYEKYGKVVISAINESSDTVDGLNFKDDDSLKTSLKEFTPKFVEAMSKYGAVGFQSGVKSEDAVKLSIISDRQKPHVDVKQGAELFGEKSFFQVLLSTNAHSTVSSIGGKKDVFADDLVGIQSAVDACSRVGAVLKTNLEKKPEMTSASIETVSTSDVADGCDKLVAMLEIIAKNDKTTKDIADAKKKVQDEQDALTKDITSSDVKGGPRKIAETMAKVMINNTATVDKVMVEAVQIASSVANEILSVYDKSLSNHKEK